ncbi:oxidoreductase [Paenibacillus sp. SYP-B3998]|uniref:Oxidoreductase n=1 Tax=Paenibacillus sp. SYP-B3998 TaxID=2678564 RepID=A0A6G3ZXR5_9BACL|nr:oxidoreductase [Paenibacillus sp. SYP-B3998]NEW06880.1 oxidoreductase [Paenibacillus sp. SYP-B3998]
MRLNTFSTKQIINETNYDKSFYDFFIDGRSLYKLLEKHEFIPCIPVAASKYKVEIVQELTLKRLSKLGGNRYPILVCPECGDLDCGFISAIIEEENDLIIWRDFKKGEALRLTHLGPYYFEKKNYMKTIQGTITSTETSARLT